MKLDGKRGFFFGALLAGFIVSVVTYGVPAISSLNVFSAGSVISSAQINANFEKLSGTVLISGNSGGSIRYVDDTDLVNHSTGCFPTGSPRYCIREKLDFTVDYISDAANLITKTENLSFYTNNGQNYKMYKIPVTGWYEVSVTNDTAFTQTFVCAGTSCRANSWLSGMVRIYKLDGSNNIIHPSSYSSVMTSASYYQDDNDGNSSWADNPAAVYDLSIGETRKMYLKAGLGITLELEANHEFINITGNYTYQIPANGIKFKLTRLYND